VFNFLERGPFQREFLRKIYEEFAAEPPEQLPKQIAPVAGIQPALLTAKAQDGQRRWQKPDSGWIRLGKFS